MDQLERHLTELQSRFSSSRRDKHSQTAALPATSSAAAAAVAAVADVTGFAEIATELDIYERVLQVLSGETNKLLELVKKSSDNEQQHRSKLDTLQNRVNRFKLAQVNFCSHCKRFELEQKMCTGMFFQL